MDLRRLTAVWLIALVARPWSAAQELPVPRGTPPTPTVASRPQNWPGGRPAPDLQPLEMTTVVARVGPEVILAGDVSLLVRELLAGNVERIPAGAAEQYAREFLKQAIDNAVSRKALYLEARRKFPDEHFEKIKKSIDEEFEKKEIRELMKRTNCAHRGEFEKILEERGTSMAREKQNFLERTLAGIKVQEAIKEKEEITHDDMLDYYRTHAKDFDRKAKARWLHLFIRRGERSDAESKNKIAWMGNQVLAGKPWAEIAKHHSDHASAVDGGDRGWTTQGSLASKTLDTALFQLPVGSLSPILEDEQGWHILRVEERQQAGRVPFVEAQEEIRDKIAENRRRERVKNYISEVRSNTKIWTIFDDPPAADRLTAYLAAPVAHYLRETAKRNGGPSRR